LYKFLTKRGGKKIPSLRIGKDERGMGNSKKENTVIGPRPTPLRGKSPRTKGGGRLLFDAEGGDVGGGHGSGQVEEEGNITEVRVLSGEFKRSDIDEGKKNRPGRRLKCGVLKGKNLGSKALHL